MVYSSQIRPAGEALQLLRRRAASQGYLTSADIDEVYPGEDRYQLQALLLSLRKMGVEILGGDLDPEVELETEAEADQFTGLPSHVPCPDPAATEDILSLYFREMSSFPLLSLEEEKSITQRIERGRQAAVQLPISREHVAGRKSPDVALHSVRAHEFHRVALQ